jgi:hypothetical protein
MTITSSPVRSREKRLAVSSLHLELVSVFPLRLWSQACLGNRSFSHNDKILSNEGKPGSGAHRQGLAFATATDSLQRVGTPALQEKTH